jgi:predicted amidohydrolase
MRIALLQTAGDPSGTPAANLDLLADAAARAKAGGADLLVAPEMFLTGYAIGREAAAERAEPADGASARRAGEIAQANGMALAYGYPEMDDGSIYNAAVLIDAGGRTLLNYRKAHLFAALDRSMFAAGPGTYETARLGPFNVGLLICYDVEFPEAPRALALAGADLILVPTANMRPYQPVSHLLVPARAYENAIYVAYANRCGSEADLDYYGLSSVAGPAGGNLVMAGDGEELVFADIESGAVDAARAVNTQIKDRRPEIYRALADMAGR